jgi:hypothetical protein
MVDQYLIAVLFMLNITFIPLLLEKAKGIYVFIQQVVLADAIDKLTAFADDASFYLF